MSRNSFTEHLNKTSANFRPQQAEQLGYRTGQQFHLLPNFFFMYIKEQDISRIKLKIIIDINNKKKHMKILIKICF